MHSQFGFIQHVCAYSLLITTGQCQTSIQNSFMALLFMVSFSWSRPISRSSDSFRSTFSTSAGPLTSAPPVTNGESVSTRTLSIPIRLTAFLKFLQYLNKNKNVLTDVHNQKSIHLLFQYLFHSLSVDIIIMLKTANIHKYLVIYLTYFVSPFKGLLFDQKSRLFGLQINLNTIIIINYNMG
ncbi:Hypothetical_protein [Hexamita inflata]|uniref:Hypothetical_protein n=1 Tax=Hexamita inflata TaxID=28002 RepID=A0ABP1JT25_9EUKA